MSLNPHPNFQTQKTTNFLTWISHPDHNSLHPLVTRRQERRDPLIRCCEKRWQSYPSPRPKVGQLCRAGRHEVGEGPGCAGGGGRPEGRLKHRLRAGGGKLQLVAGGELDAVLGGGGGQDLEVAGEEDVLVGGQAGSSGGGGD